MVGSKNGVSYDEESNDTLELNQYGKHDPSVDAKDLMKQQG